MSVIYLFPYDSPVRCLPLAYMLPYDVIFRYLTLSKPPRSMGALNAFPGWGKVILSQQFLNEIIDAMASLAFPHFGFSGWQEHYTGYSPVWRLSYALPLWAKGVEKCGAGAFRRPLPCPRTMRFFSVTQRMCAKS